LAAVTELSFVVAPGFIHVLIGQNDAGKTTLFTVISGFYSPRRGQVLY
jgi:branched-chain amino acid transport system ATP-binding protein